MMRSRYYNVHPTRTLRGLLCRTLGTVGGTSLWLLVTSIALIPYILYWVWVRSVHVAQAIRARFDQPFREERSIVWCTVIALGAIVGGITGADLWPALIDAVALLAGAEGGL